MYSKWHDTKVIVLKASSQLSRIMAGSDNFKELTTFHIGHVLSERIGNTLTSCRAIHLAQYGFCLSPTALISFQLQLCKFGWDPLQPLPPAPNCPKGLCKEHSTTWVGWIIELASRNRHCNPFSQQASLQTKEGWGVCIMPVEWLHPNTFAIEEPLPYLAIFFHLAGLLKILLWCRALQFVPMVAEHHISRS